MKKISILINQQTYVSSSSVIQKILNIYTAKLIPIFRAQTNMKHRVKVPSLKNYTNDLIYVIPKTIFSISFHPELVHLLIKKKIIDAVYWTVIRAIHIYIRHFWSSF